MRRATTLALALATVAAFAPAADEDEMAAALQILASQNVHLAAFIGLDAPARPLHSSMPAKHSKGIVVTREAPPGGDLTVAFVPPEVLLRLTATAPNVRLVHRTLEASRGDFTLMMDAGWPALLAPFGDAFLQVNLHGPDGKVFDSIGLIGSYRDNSEAGVPTGACYTYGGPTDSGLVTIPLAIGAAGSRLRIRARLQGTTLYFEGADAAGGEWTPVATWEDLFPNDGETSHTVETGWTIFAKEGIVLTSGVTGSGAFHEVTDLALEGIASSLATAHDILGLLEEGQTETPATQLDGLIGGLGTWSGTLEGLDPADLVRAAIPRGVTKGAAKSLAAAAKALAKARDQANLEIADPKNGVKGLLKIAEAGALLKRLKKTALRTWLP
jgi:hypothetical protein